ncbi:MAG: RHS repeat-associated core domain-containing protein [Gemmataceae bacterium]
MSRCASRRRRPWFLRAFTLFDKASERCGRDCRSKKARLRLTSLEERIAPALSIVQVDAVAYAGKTVAVRLSHSGSGTPAGSLNWGDGSTTVSLSSWSYSTASITFSHSYTSTGAFTVTAKDTNLSNTATATLNVAADVPPMMPVDGGAGLEWGKTATPIGNTPNNISSGSVRYADGVVKLSFPDVSVSGYGMPWGPARSWSNGGGYDAGGDNGNGWVESQLPSLVQVAGTNILSLVIDGTNARTFDLTPTANTYRERFFGQDSLVYDTGTSQYVLTTPDGVQYRFVNFTASATASRGQFDSRTDPDGNATLVYSRNTAGNVTEIRRGSGAESWYYEYYTSGDNSGKLQRVTLRRGSSGSYTDLRKVEYAYYGTSEDNGNLGDLKTAIIKDGSGNTISTQFYRYYKPGEASGYPSALKMALIMASYDRAHATYSNMDTATDTQLRDYADFYFEYDSSHRVSLERVQGQGCSICSGGIGDYSFSYTTSAFAAGMNVWTTKTTEVVPGAPSGSTYRNVVYSNVYGQVMLKVAQELSGSTVTQEWPTYYRYDSDGRLILTANPSAMQQSSSKYYDDTRADLIANDHSTITALSASDVRVNTHTTSNQMIPRVAHSALGSSVVVWQSYDQDGDSWGVYGQRYDAAGQAVGSEFQINQTTLDYQGYPQVAMDAVGNFTVVWQSYNFTESDFDIYSRAYDRFGTALTSEVVVDTITTTDQQTPTIAMTSDGRYVVSWLGRDSSGYGVFAQRFDADGTANGSQIGINATTMYDQFIPSVAIDSAGNFVVSWTGWNGTASASGVSFRRFDSSGTALDANDVFVHAGYSTQVACDAAGNFVVTFDDDSLSSDSEVYCQRYDASGSAQGSLIQVNTYTTNSQELPAVAMDTDGDFVVTWASDGQDGSNYGIYAQAYQRDGTTAGSNFRVNVYTTNSQYVPAVASDTEGNFTFAWESYGQDGNQFGIYSRRYSVDGLSPYLQDSAGLITTFAYGTTTTAGSSTAGDVAGFLKQVTIRRGEGSSTTVSPQAAYQYFEKTAGGLTVHPLATSTVYRNDDGTGGQMTSNAYTYASSSVRITQVTVTYPTVTTAQNGPNSADSMALDYDSYGRLRWTQDGDGFLNYMEYDDASGGLTKRIVDVDTVSNKSDYSTTYGTAPWSTPSGGGLRLISQYAVDFLGRTTKVTDPESHVTYTFYDDDDHEIRVYPGWDSTTHTTTGPIQVFREDWGREYREVLTMAPSSIGYDTATLAPLGTDSISSVQSLSRTILNHAGQAIEQDAYFKLSDVTYGAATVTLTGPSSAVRHYATKTDYADRGGVKRTETPTGTITRYVRDALNRVIEIWVGTNDTPTTGYWSPTNTTGADLVKVQTYEYDNGGMGDNNVTKLTQIPGGSATDRITLTYFDWRDRAVATKQGAQSSETASLDTNRPIGYRIYDNLNGVTEARTYDGDNVSITSTNGVPGVPSSSLLRSKSVTDFDERGRVYRVHSYDVDPSNGSVGSHELDSDTWYNRRGRAIKSLVPGGLVTKSVYDGAGRVTVQYASDGGSDPAPGASSNWSHADDVIDDIVYEQSEYFYDKSGNVQYAIQRQRFHNATGTGALQDISTNPKARVSYQANYYDVANRLTTTANYGTYGGSSWSFSSSAPSASDTILVASRAYDAAGRLLSFTDPLGLVTRYEYDALGRTTKTIQNYTGTGAINNSYPDQNKTIEIGYDGMNHMTSYKAWLNSTDYELTEYDYGVTSGSGSMVNSKDLLGVINYPDAKSVGAVQAQFTYTYNALGQRISLTDIKETKHEYAFDVVGRSTADAITSYKSGAIDAGVLRLTTEYDSAGRAYRFTSYDAATSGSVVNQVQRAFNGFGQLAQEYQSVSGAVSISTTPSVQYNYATSGNSSRLEHMVYPNGRTLDYNYSGDDDTISRLSSISDSSVTLEGYSYLGLSTPVQRTHSESKIDQTFIDTLTTGDAGDQYYGLDRFGRVVKQLWQDDRAAAKVNIAYGYDADGNRLYKADALASGFDELYTYDGLNQLTSFDRGTLSYGPLAISSSTRTQSWSPDGLGNFSSVSTDGTTQTRSHDLQNKLTQVVTGSTTATLGYDSAGNMTTDETGRTFLFDAWNRPVKVNGTVRNGYDALGRRVKEGSASLFYSDKWQVVEERNGSTVTYTYAWSPAYVDAVVARDHYTSGTLDERLYALQDANWNVVALVQAGTGVVERYVYDPYGNFTKVAANWGTYSGTDRGWVYLHQGGRWDAATEMLAFRNRDYSPTLMRWNRMDPIGFGGRDSNLFRFVGDNPNTWVDPSGLACVVPTYSAGAQGVGPFFGMGVNLPINASVMPGLNGPGGMGSAGGPFPTWSGNVPAPYSLQVNEPLRPFAATYGSRIQEWVVLSVFTCAKTGFNGWPPWPSSYSGYCVCTMNTNNPVKGNIEFPIEVYKAAKSCCLVALATIIGRDATMTNCVETAMWLKYGLSVTCDCYGKPPPPGILPPGTPMPEPYKAVR